MSADAFDEDFGPDEPEPRPLPPSPLEVQARPDDAAAWARSVAPGSDTLAVLALLNPARMSDAGRIDAIAAVEAGIAHLTAIQNGLLASLTRQPGPAPDDKKWESLEVSCVLGISAQAAERRLVLARDLTHGRLAPAGAAMATGVLSPWRATVLAKELMLCDDTTAAIVQAEVLPNAAGQTFGQYQKAIGKSVLTHSALVVLEQREQSAARRGVFQFRPDEYGMQGLYSYLPVEANAAVYATLNRAAYDCNTDDPRTLDQRRADALIQLATTGTLAGGSAEAALKPAVNVTVAASTLLGYDEQAGELNGQPIPAELARRLAADETGTWRRLLTDERGVLIDYGRKTYRPPAALAQFVKARDRECVFPTCSRPADTCDVDHETAWATGRGQTNEPNLASVSPRHHKAKHDGGWNKQRLPDGSTKWISPTDHEYTKPPATYPIDRTGLPDPGDDPPF